MSSTDIGDPGHGNSPAAWIAVAIMLVGFVTGTVAFWLDLPWLVWGGAGIILVGLIVGWILSKFGYGVGGSKWISKVH